MHSSCRWSVERSRREEGSLSLKINNLNIMTGTIVKIVGDRGFGFIKPEEGDKELFFHARSMDEGVFDQLEENDKVTYEIEEGPKGPAAINVMKAE